MPDSLQTALSQLGAAGIKLPSDISATSIEWSIGGLFAAAIVGIFASVRCVRSFREVYYPHLSGFLARCLAIAVWLVLFFWSPDPLIATIFFAAGSATLFVNWQIPNIAIRHLTPIAWAMVAVATNGFISALISF